MSNELPHIGQAPVTTEALTLNVFDATITVRHEERADIAVFANYPAHWEVGANGTIRQIASRQLHSDLWVLLQICGRKLGAKIGKLFRRVTNDVPTVSAETSPTQATPVPPPAMPQYGPDELLVVVPINYRGGLDLDVAGSGQTEIDDWQGDSAAFVYGSSGTLTVGDIKVTGAFSIDHCNDGNVDLGDVEAGSIDLSFKGDGNHTLGDFKAAGDLALHQENSTGIEVGNLTGANVDVDLNGDYGITTGTITATGRLTLKRYGDGDLTVAALTGDIVETTLAGCGTHDIGDVSGNAATIDHNDGDADVDVAAVQCTSFTLNHASDGDVDIEVLHTTVLNMEVEGCGNVTVNAGSAQSGRVHNGGDLSLTLTGRFGYISHRNDGDGSIEVEITE
jgi:hypothetical protein